ncbi:DUF4139 domain-containing protein [Haloferula sargassicola]|uniref:DUF4139 domain-containing protein n=1 Tax=Haloferula sargassicola TaxID=490096 RepID=A0ABP9UNX0_9BACT
MKTTLFLTTLAAAASAEPALTIYNRNLAVVRETLPLELAAGEKSVSFDRATAQVHPDSVVLRDPTGEHDFSILEQSYRNDPVSRWLLLSQFEGKTIQFSHTYPDGRVELVDGKIIRSGYVPGGQPTGPIIEVEGKMMFSLPGEPLFPSLGDGSILRPTLSWQIASPQAASFDAQLSYLTRGFSWEADYNLVAPENGETVSLTGWVTVNNQSGTGFDDAKVKLVAGDVNVIEPQIMPAARMKRTMNAFAAEQKVQEKAFDDFHLYSLPRPLTIRDKETKQVEFLRSPEVTASKKYVYDGAEAFRFHGGLQTEPSQGQTFPKDVAVYWEFKNSEENGLGVPLPAGRVRFYREDSEDGNLEFVGENDIDHTPRNERLSIYTGNAFDLVGERKITNFESREREKWMRESVEVTVKNRSKEAKSILVREHLWRWSNWEIRDANADFEKKDAQTIEFTVNLQPDEEKKLTYTAHYTW